MLVEGTDYPATPPLTLLCSRGVHIDVELGNAPAGPVGECNKELAATTTRAGVMNNEATTRSRSAQQVGDDSHRVCPVDQPSVCALADLRWLPAP